MMASHMLYLIVWLVAIVQSFLVLLFTVGLIFRLKKVNKRVCIVVLGDVGRSPRMQYHAYSYTLAKYSVDIVGFCGSKEIASLRNNENISFSFLAAPPKKPKHIPGILFYILKTIYQTVQLLILLLFVVEKPNHFLVQNPPAIPTLFAVWITCCLKGSSFIIDWHNYAYTILSLNIGNKKHPLVKFSKIYEKLLGRMSDKNICVTKAMQTDLRVNWNIEADVLYDRPPVFFKKTELEEKHELFLRLSREAELKAALFDSNSSTVFTEEKEGSIIHKSDRPALLISSTSWTEDEDFSILLRALENYEKERSNRGNLPNIICIITGKGPLKEYYMNIIKEKKFKFVNIITPWLEAEDYPKVIGSGDLGICLHTSSSGLDLPMKVVDMFGCGLPVCAIGFECLNELVKHNENGQVFATSEELAEQITDLLKDFPSSTKTLDEFRKNLVSFQENRWDDNWRRVMLPLIASK